MLLARWLEPGQTVLLSLDKSTLLIYHVKKYTSVDTVMSNGMYICLYDYFFMTISVLYLLMHFYYSMPSVEGDDFTVMSPDVFEATFTSGSMIGDIACDNITIVDDSDLEGTQSFTVQINGSSPSGDQIVTAATFTTVFIEDNEGTLCMSSVLRKTYESVMALLCMKRACTSNNTHNIIMPSLQLYMRLFGLLLGT